MNPNDQQAAENDRDLLGTGYLYDGKRLDPARLTILTTPPAADAGAVAWVDATQLAKLANDECSGITCGTYSERYDRTTPLYTRPGAGRCG
jgi:glycerol-3-phosphate dehydrogenase